MLAILEFIFSSFWVFLGTLMLSVLWLKATLTLVLGIVAIIRGGNINIS